MWDTIRAEMLAFSEAKSFKNLYYFLILIPSLTDF